VKKRRKKLLKGEVRIIGGKWRSRKIAVPNIDGLRPTPDSVRETVFNWLQQDIVGAHCLDLFSGTGVMAFEALSRGATKVTLVEQSKLVCKHLYESAEKLKIEATAYKIIQQDAVAWLEKARVSKPGQIIDPAFDVVFLDPPYHKDYLKKVLPLLFSRGDLLKAKCLIYIESEKELSSDLLPENSEMIKHKKAGMVHYSLVRQQQV
jgi:16S rRNA (guanine966-N2)-methyltransferase